MLEKTGRHQPGSFELLKKKGIPKTPSPATAASNPGDLDPADPKDEKDVLLSVLKVANGDRSLVRFETKKKNGGLVVAGS